MKRGGKYKVFPLFTLWRDDASNIDLVADGWFVPPENQIYTLVTCQHLTCDKYQENINEISKGNIKGISKENVKDISKGKYQIRIEA